jgi:hypothetical protein
VKVLIYFWQKAEYTKAKRKPGQESPIGNLGKIRNQGEMSFEYRIAEYRGMRPDQFSRALRELFQYGFIDLPHHGRGVKGDYTKFSFSDRWKMYGSDSWVEIPFPDNDKVGFRSEEYKRRQRERRERERTEKSYYGKAELLTTESRSYSPPESPIRLRNRVVKKDVSGPGVTTDSRSLLRSFHALKDLEGDRREGSAPDTGSKAIAAPIRRDDADTSYRIATDPQAIADLAAALSSIGHLPDEGMAKRKPGRPRRTLDPKTAPILDRGYDPDLGPWAEDEAMTASIGRGGTVH